MLVSMGTYTVVVPVTNDLPARSMVSVPVQAATRTRAAHFALRTARAEGYGVDRARRTRVTRNR